MSSYPHRDDAKAQTMADLSEIEAGIRFVQALVNEDAPCPAILRETAALQMRLARIERAFLLSQLHGCLTDLCDGRSEILPAECSQMLDIFSAMCRLKRTGTEIGVGL
jgi:DNA-binding FrmR family transcriptional regulator